MNERALAPTHNFVAAEDFRFAMRQLASSVNLITSGTGDGRRGLTATAVCSLSASPPSVLVCLNKQTQCLGVIRETGAFAVNVLPRGNVEAASRFAGRDGSHGVDRFRADEWIASDVNGVPFYKNAVVALDCTLLQCVDFESHIIVIGGIQQSYHDRQSEPMLYWNGEFCSIGT